MYAAVDGIKKIDDKSYCFLEGLIHFKDDPTYREKSFFNIFKEVEDINHLKNILRHYGCNTGLEDTTKHINRFLDDEIQYHDRYENGVDCCEDLRDEISHNILMRLQQN